MTLNNGDEVEFKVKDTKDENVMQIDLDLEDGTSLRVSVAVTKIIFNGVSNLPVSIPAYTVQTQIGVLVTKVKSQMKLNATDR